MVFIAAATSALLHACWNMLAQRHSAPRDALYGITLATAALCAIALPVVGTPPRNTWPWIAMAGFCNILYLRTLGKAYAHPDFCAVYAIVRAIVPAMLFLVGWLVLSEPGRFGAVAGLAIVAISILVFSAPRKHIRRLDVTTLAHSGSAGLLLSLALFFDIHGIRTNSESLANLIQYTVASSLITATGIAVVALMDRVNPFAILVGNSMRCYAASILMLCSYLLGMWAYAQGPVGLVAPVRESSVLFGGGLTVLVLKQHVTKAQWTAMLLAAIGIMLIQVG